MIEMKVKKEDEKEVLILIVNPKLEYSSGAGIGSILAHEIFAEKHGAVYWDYLGMTKKKDMTILYFYDVSKGRITHKADVLAIMDSEKVSI